VRPAARGKEGKTLSAAKEAPGQTLRDIRRVVTGVSPDGKSVIVSDGPSPRSVTLELLGGTKMTDLWHLGSPPESPTDGGDLDRNANLVPPPGGIHWRTTDFPPDSAIPADININDLAAEVNEKVPDLVAHADLSRLGMHQTETIDFGVVLSGEIWLELDDGEVHLKAGDCVVQRGTMHAWRNRSDKPCVMSFVLIDASPKGAR
jgi:mannose-6-phosphate isomerase-like protein (cupin superfamily)